MPNTLRFGSALSVLAVATLTGGCAGPMERAGRSSFGSVDMAKVALGTRAQLALAGQDYASAVDLAEQAVAQSPEDAGFRALLGNAYFASGRFASAETAYRESLSLFGNQPQVALKLALVQIAQGRNSEAVSFLHSARGNLNASDFGLALALAGQPAEAIIVLEAAARAPGADAQLRQNLALAYALAGDWTASRVVAAQDLSPDLVDARLQQWMTLAAPRNASDQVAALVGVKPAASDPGQPVRLALNANGTRVAAAAAPTPSSVETVQLPPVVEAAPPAVELAAAEVVAAPPVAVPDLAPEPVQAVAEAEPIPAYEAPKAPVLTEAAPLPAPLRKAASARAAGKSAAVVQIGAYSSRENVSRAWDQLTKRYPALKGYEPMVAQFDTGSRTLYRLSIKGFDTQRDALARCTQLRGRGGSCFVRTVAGDAPIRMAAR